MTRKDYVAIAESFAKFKPERDIFAENQDIEHRAASEEWEGLRMSIANVLSEDNPRFDRERFYNACEGK